MPSFADSIFLFILALLLFGPKKLPVLARELGKWVGEFRRASNEFKMQMEEELRASEQADRQKQVAAIEAAAPIPPPLGEPEVPEHPHLRSHRENKIAPPPSTEAVAVEPEATDAAPETAPVEDVIGGSAEAVRPVPIASSGSLHMMPPATGLPTPRGRGGANGGTALLEAAREAESSASIADPTASPSETFTHGD